MGSRTGMGSPVARPAPLEGGPLPGFKQRVAPSSRAGYRHGTLE